MKSKSAVHYHAMITLFKGAISNQILYLCKEKEIAITHKLQTFPLQVKLLLILLQQEYERNNSGSSSGGRSGN